MVKGLTDLSKDRGWGFSSSTHIKELTTACNLIKSKRYWCLFLISLGMCTQVHKHTCTNTQIHTIKTFL